MNGATLIDRCQMMVAERSESKSSDSEQAHGIPNFLDQLIRTLSLEQVVRDYGDVCQAVGQDAYLRLIGLIMPLVEGTLAHRG